MQQSEIAETKEIIEMNDGILQWKTYEGSGWNTVNSTTAPKLKMSFDEDIFKISKKPPTGNLEDIMTINENLKIILSNNLKSNSILEISAKEEYVWYLV